MAIHLRSLSARRYRIEGEMTGLEGPALLQRLGDRRFRPLSANEERTYGWVRADNCLDTAFHADAVVHGEWLVVALRVDHRRVSSRLLRAMVDLEMRGRRKDAGVDGHGAVGRDERARIRRDLAADLLRNTSPSMSVVPVCVRPAQRLVLFGSLSRGANEVFRALFADTFDATLATLTPYHRAVELLRDRGASQALAPLRRTEFSRVASTSEVAS